MADTAAEHANVVSGHMNIGQKRLEETGHQEVLDIDGKTD
jgi:hypothetical protein